MLEMYKEPQEVMSIEHHSLDRAFAKKTEQVNFCFYIREKKCISMLKIPKNFFHTSNVSPKSDDLYP